MLALALCLALVYLAVAVGAFLVVTYKDARDALAPTPWHEKGLFCFLWPIVGALVVLVLAIKAVTLPMRALDRRVAALGVSHRRRATR